VAGVEKFYFEATSKAEAVSIDVSRLRQGNKIMNEWPFFDIAN
jgi:hypothetical protein